MHQYRALNQSHQGLYILGREASSEESQSFVFLPQRIRHSSHDQAFSRQYGAPKEKIEQNAKKQTVSKVSYLDFFELNACYKSFGGIQRVEFTSAREHVGMRETALRVSKHPVIQL